MFGAKRDFRDIIGGALMMLAGAFAAAHSLIHLRLGTMASMGPGMFPTALGAILFVLGVGIAVPALFRRGRELQVDFRSLVAVVLGMLCFGATVEPFGLIPAIVILIVVVSRADSRLSILGATLLALGLGSVAAAIFRLGLNLQLPLVAWPW